MRINPFQAVYPNFDYVASTDTFFNTVKVEYSGYRKSGFFHKTPQEGLYIYQIITKERTFTGLVTATDIRDYKDDKIKKHENTLTSKEQQQLNLLISRNAMVKPVLLTYPGVKSINKIINSYIKKNKPYYSCEIPGEKQTHKVWEIADGAAIREIQNLFKKEVPKSYIADGHHRTSTSALLYERMKKKGDKKYDQLLAVYFPVSELEVHDYNRVVEGLEDCTPTMFMVKMGQIFDIEILDEPAKPENKHEITLFINREWYKLTWKKSVLKEYQKKKVLLDANMLDEKVLRDILGITDVRTDTRISYVEGPKGVDAVRSQVIKSRYRIGFCLYPVDLKDLMKVADNGKTMPPKSTWFEPRVKNGMIILEL